MLEVLAARTAYEYFQDYKEMFEDKEKPAAKPKPKPAKKDEAASVMRSPGAIIGTIIAGLLYLGILAWAAMLSWKSNTIAGWSFLPKLIFAVLSALFAISYLITHAIYKLDLLMVIDKLQPALVQ